MFSHHCSAIIRRLRGFIMGIRNNQNIKIVQKKGLSSKIKVKDGTTSNDKDSLITLFNNIVPQSFDVSWVEKPSDSLLTDELKDGLFIWKEFKDKRNKKISVLKLIDFILGLYDESNLTRRKKPLAGNRDFVDEAIRFGLLEKDSQGLFQLSDNARKINQVFWALLGYAPFDWDTIISGEDGEIKSVGYLLENNSYGYSKPFLIDCGDGFIVCNWIFDEALPQVMPPLFFISKETADDLKKNIPSTEIVSEQVFLMNKNYQILKDKLKDNLTAPQNKITIEAVPFAINRNGYDTVFTGNSDGSEYYFNVQNNSLQLLQKMYGTDLDFYFTYDNNSTSRMNWGNVFCKHKDKLFYTQRTYLAIDTAGHWLPMFIYDKIKPLLQEYNKD